MSKRLLVGSSGVVGLLVVAVMMAPQAGASIIGVSGSPAAWTPYLASPNGNVSLIRQCGPTMYAVGTFSSVAGPTQAPLARNNIFSFNSSTGLISSWNPNVNGTVDTIAFSSDCSSAYIGGSFTTVGATAAHNLAKVSTSTAAVDAAFGRSANGEVTTMAMSGSHLLIGGYFTSINNSPSAYLSSLNPSNGQKDGYLTLPVTGTLGSGFTTHIYKFELSHTGNRLLASGVFTSVGGVARRQIFMLDLGSSATLDPWYSSLFNGTCTSSELFFTKGFNWSPDDSTVYVATTGYKGAELCDAAAAFSSTPKGNHNALWLNKTGCDSLFATAADTNDVYLGGHERWANNPDGCDNAGPGAVSRPGVGDLDPVSGLATAWNPTRSRGHGADDLYLDPTNDLWVASDNGNNSYTQCGGKYHPGICMFPHS